ncbi:unnamed protein product [Calypogeia fissa]
MTKKLVREVAIEDREHPKKVEAAKQSESVAKAREGTSSPLPMGLPAPLSTTPRVARGGTPKGTPKGAPTSAKGEPTSRERGPPRNKSEAKVVVEGERVVTPPQPTVHP